MSAQETAILTEEMMLSGEVIDLSHIAKPKIDKYSTGGVGDKTSLVLVPLAMASGVVVPMMCGVEHDYVINTLDKLRHSRLQGPPDDRAFRQTSSPASAAPSSSRSEDLAPADRSSTSSARRPARSRASRSSPAACFPRSSPRVPRAS
jgi:pyrimidine-nucleoside phosphorylase